MCGTNGEVGRVGTAVRRGRHGVMEYLGQVEKTRKEERLGTPQVKNGAPLYTLQNETQISTSSVPFCAQGPSWWTALLAKPTLASIVVCFVFILRESCYGAPTGLKLTEICLPLPSGIYTYIRTGELA